MVEQGMKIAALSLVILFLAGCASTQPATKQASAPNGFENMGLVRQMSCYSCLKPANETEAVYLRTLRDTLNRMLGDK
jgi:PBP1b-binding outer membrane lipoprotein LpoB